MQKAIYSILAIDNELGFGKNNTLPWRLSKDMAFFKGTTLKTKDKNKVNAVVMGRKTWESIPEKFRPLFGRINCILTREQRYTDLKDTFYFSSLENVIKSLNNNKNIENIFIIGGASLYNSILNNSNLKNIFLTRVEGNFDCDVFFDGVPDNFKLEEKSETIEENGIKFNFENWKRKNN